jgi:carbohydrate diacid regulator
MESDIALIKEVRSNVEMKDLEKLARPSAILWQRNFSARRVFGIGTCVTGV